MTTDALFTVWCDIELRVRIKNTARSLTRSDIRYKALVAKGWEVISEALPDKTPEHYYRLADAAMCRYISRLRYDV